MTILITKKNEKNVFHFRLGLLDQDFRYEDLVNFGFENVEENNKNFEESIEEWVKQSGLDYSIKNSIKNVIFEKNITTATIERQDY